jgi:hypothetical protein
MIVRMVNAIARTIPKMSANLAGFGFGAMYPSWRQIDVAMPDFRGANWKRCVSYFTLRWLSKNARWPKNPVELADAGRHMASVAVRAAHTVSRNLLMLTLSY